MTEAQRITHQEEAVAAIEAGLASSDFRKVAEHLLRTGRINENSTFADGIEAMREYYGTFCTSNDEGARQNEDECKSN